MLQRPFEEVLKSGKPDFPFCLAWANHDWTTKTWNRGRSIIRGTDNTYIAKQEYPGDEDYTNHFNYLLSAFKDHRYIRIDDKPVFFIFDPYHFSDVSHFMDLWREIAIKNGLPGIYFVAIANSTTTIRRLPDGSTERVIPNLQSSKKVYNDILSLGFDAINSWGKSRAEMIEKGKYLRLIRFQMNRLFPILPTSKLDYPKVMKHFFAPEDSWENIFPSIMPQWDRSPRASSSDGIYINATPEHFKKHIKQALAIIANKQPEHQILMLRSWNEWGEGNYVEPDQQYGHGFLNAIRDSIIS